jgi:MFS family permease
METAAERPASWRELFQGGRALTAAVVCLGVWLNAVDALVAATIMPSVARDIGGYAYFAWATAGFLLGAILAGATAGLLAERAGLRRALAGCGLAYAAGCVASAMAGSVAAFLAGRLLQGAGAGALVGLCYVAVRTSFPERLWSGVFAVLSGVWGVATLLGPLVGGMFAGWGLWRAMFWLFALQAIGFALLVRAVPERRRPAGAGVRHAPVRQLIVLAAAVLMVAAASALGSALLAGAAVLAGVLLLAMALRLDRRSACRLLPRQAHDPGSRAAQGYAAVFALSAAAITFSVYGAALLQARLKLSPLQAGYVVASESIGWTVTALLVARAPRRLQPLCIRLGAAAVAAGLAGCALTLSRSGVAIVFGCGAVMGGGFGLCWSFISQRVLNALPEADAAIGSSAIPTLQVLGNAVGAAGAGVIANLLGLGEGFSAGEAGRVAPWLIGSFTPVALAGVAAAWRLSAE